MKLSDNKLDELLRPLIEKEVEAYGFEKLTIEGKRDQSGDEAIYIDVWVKNNNFERGELSFVLNRAIRLKLQNEDERVFHYVNLHAPPLSKARLDKMILESNIKFENILVSL